jgi:hypothetical protein
VCCRAAAHLWPSMVGTQRGKLMYALITDIGDRAESHPARSFADPFNAKQGVSSWHVVIARTR